MSNRPILPGQGKYSAVQSRELKCLGKVDTPPRKIASGPVLVEIKVNAPIPTKDKEEMSAFLRTSNVDPLNDLMLQSMNDGDSDIESP